VKEAGIVRIAAEFWPEQGVKKELAPAFRFCIRMTARKVLNSSNAGSDTDARKVEPKTIATLKNSN